MYNIEFQRKVIKLFCSNLSFAVSQGSYIKRDYFDDQNLRVIFEIAKNFIYAYNTEISQEDMVTKIDSYSMSHGFSNEQLKKLNEESKYIYRASISSEQYIVDELLKFCRKQEMKKALFKAYEILKEDSDNDKSYEQVVSMFDNAVSVGMGSDLGYEFDDLLELPLRYREKYNKDTLVTTGFPTFDDAIMGGMGPGELHVFASVPKGGKCLAKGTKVLMFDGSLKKVEDIKLNDFIMGMDSKPRKILALDSGIDKLYEIKQNYGISYTVNESHILSLKNSKNKKIIDISIKEYLTRSDRFKDRHKGFKVSVEYPFKETALDPYLVGLLAASKYHINQIKIRDDDILKRVKEIVSELCLDSSLRKYRDGGYVIKLINPSNSKLPLSCFNRGFNYLYLGKKIPEEYLINSREIRLNLLAGLMESNAFAAGLNVAIFVSRHHLICEQFLLLARSLGFKSKFVVSKKIKTELFRVSISGDFSVIPFASKDRFPFTKSKKDISVTGIKVVPVGIGEYFGFELDGDGRFLLEDFTVTHNTTFGAVLGANVLATGKTVYHATLEIKKDDLLLKYAAAITGMDIKELLACDMAQYQRSIQKFKKYKPNLFVNYWTEGTASTLEIRSWISKKRADTSMQPSVIIVDYDDPLTGDTLIPMLDGTERRIDSLVSEKEFWLYACKKDGEIVPGRGHSARIARYVDELIEITLDNGKSIKSTSNHNHMLRDGTYKRADEFEVGDSMMPLYRRVDSLGYELVRCNKSKEYNRTHRVVSESFGDIREGFEVHHKNQNKRDNRPENLEVISKKDHVAEHWDGEFYNKKSEMTKEQWKDDGFRKKFTDGVNKKWEDQNWRDQRSKQSSEQMYKRFEDQKERDKVAENFKELWKDPEHKKKMSEKSKARWSDPEFKERLLTQKKEHFCEYCKKTFMLTRGEVRSHKSKCKNSIIGDRECPHCKKVLKISGEDFIKHKDYCRKKVIKEFHCPICNKVINGDGNKILRHKRECKDPNNHKVLSVRRIKLEESIPVYCLSVDEYQNYALSAGIFTHNCLIPTGKQTESMYENSSQIYSDLIGLADYFKCPVVTLSQSKWESWSLPEKGELIQHCHLSHSSRKSHKAFTVSSLNFALDSKYGILYLDIARRGTSKIKIPIYRDLGRCLIVENRAENNE